jgi:hypothetical protein
MTKGLPLFVGGLLIVLLMFISWGPLIWNEWESAANFQKEVQLGGDIFADILGCPANSVEVLVHKEMIPSLARASGFKIFDSSQGIDILKPIITRRVFLRLVDSRHPWSGSGMETSPEMCILVAIENGSGTPILKLQTLNPTLPSRYALSDIGIVYFCRGNG